MLDREQPEPGFEADDRAAATPPCVALVPVVSALHRPQGSGPQRVRADFAAQLIATAEHAPQTRTLRRASPADARTAYSRGQHRSPGSGLRMRQDV